jgi:hypothetical protein
MREKFGDFRKLMVYLPIVALFLTIVYIGVQGVDFGYHWDENNHTLGVVKEFVRRGSLLGGQYVYPSVTAYLSLMVLLPYAFSFLLANVPAFGFSWAKLQRFLIFEVLRDNPSYPLNVRQTFLIITALGIVWVYFAKLEDKRGILEGLLAAAILGFSWELNYHMHWIASDGIVMQFGALVLLFSLLAISRTNRKVIWLIAAAAAAGFATGTKYPAGSLLVLVFVAGVQVWGTERGYRALFLKLAGLGAIFAASYLLSTPGTLLEIPDFTRDIKFVTWAYGIVGHGIYTMKPGLGHLLRILNYLFQVALSPYPPIAIFFFLTSLAGGYALIRESKQKAFLILSFPVFYILYFSTRKIMFVRNFMVLLPFLAILSARGIAFLYAKINRRAWKIGFATAVASMLLVNAGWLVYATGTILDRGSNRFIKELITLIDETPEQTYYVSDRIFEDMSNIKPDAAPNVTRELTDEVDVVVEYFYEAKEQRVTWTPNFPGVFPNVIGPLEINLDYYPSWQGDDRILYMPVGEALGWGIITEAGFQQGRSN